MERRQAREHSAEPCPLCASSSEAQRVRRAPPTNPGTDRAALRCARVPQKRKGCGAHHQPSQELFRAALRFARVPQKRKGRGAHHQTNPGTDRAALRCAAEFIKSAKGAARTTKPSWNRSRRTPFCGRVTQKRKGCGAHHQTIQNCFAPHSVLREFLRSAKGAARTTKPIQEPIAPHSVLREFLRSAKGAARTTNQSRNRRAALRFARVPQKRKGRGAHPKSIQEPIAPHSVLREFLRSYSGASSGAGRGGCSTI